MGFKCFNWFLLLRLVFLFFTSNQVYGQKPYPVEGQVIIEEATFHSVSVLVTDSDNRLFSINVNDNGLFDFQLNWNKVYFFHFKKPGYVSKIIEFSTFVPDSKNCDQIEPYRLKVRLFKMFPGVDTVFFKNPVAKIQYNTQFDDFDYDMDYSMQVKYKIDGMFQKSSSESVRQKDELQNNEGENDRVSKKNGMSSGHSNANTNKINKSKNNPSRQRPLTNPSNSEIPQLKESYPQGRTLEEFVLPGKTITRIVMVDNNKRTVFLKVKHNWGAVFFFKDESPMYRSITKQVFERETRVK